MENKYKYNLIMSLVGIMLFGSTVAGAVVLTPGAGTCVPPGVTWSGFPLNPAAGYCSFNNFNLPYIDTSNNEDVTEMVVSNQIVAVFNGTTSTLGDNGIIIIMDGGGLAVNTPFEIQAGGFLQVSAGGKLIPNALSSNALSLISFVGTATNPASMTIENAFTIGPGQTFTLPQYGKLHIQKSGSITIMPGGTLANEGTIDINSSTVAIQNQGTFTNSGALNITEGQVNTFGSQSSVVNTGTITVYDGGKIVSNGNSFTDSGAITLRVGSELDLDSSNGAITFDPSDRQITTCVNAEPPSQGGPNIIGTLTSGNENRITNRTGVCE